MREKRAITQPGEESSCKHDSLIAENFGRSGNNGRIGHLIGRVNSMEERLKKAEHQLLKIAMLSAAGAGAGGGIVAGLIQLLSK